MNEGETEMLKSEAILANSDNEYGWEKLYSKRLAMAFGRKYLTAVHIARFQNCYGAEGTWCDDWEETPAAMCGKVAEAAEGRTIEVRGDGTAVPSYTRADDIVNGICRLMHSDVEGAVNIGRPRSVTVYVHL